MDEVHNRLLGEHTVPIPTTRTFPELNLRTYVRSKRSGRHGVFFFSLDCASPLAVLGARTLFHLPYFLAAMHRATTAEGTLYRSQRLLARVPTRFEATYRPVTQASPLPPAKPGTLEHFLTERYCLFTSFRSRLLVGDIHHRPWSLQHAEADIRLNELPSAHGLALPDHPPTLHFSRELHVTIWPLRPDTQA